MPNKNILPETLMLREATGSSATENTVSAFPDVYQGCNLTHQYVAANATSNQFTTSKILFANHGLDMNLGLFNWFNKRNTVDAKNYNLLSNDGVGRWIV